MENNMDTIILLDEDGVECEFEIAQRFGVEENEYVVVVPVENEEEEEGILLKVIEDEEGSFTLTTVDDEAEYEVAAEVYTTLFTEE
ncbi:DUF1292 domain-containing protein [Clostridium hydrogeniformans]|uniref:DUF1292 domain-containing protein n=1 Tax=Clostridium hydrogeniformans TaxID=349933 RepID=UPI000489BBB4|nr:DUF1292 domain-containing protein [Clostridium hydrogeniformans]